MSGVGFNSEVRFSPALAKDSNLHKALLLGEFFRHATKEGIQTSPELPKTLDAFVMAVLGKPLDDVLFSATLFVGEKAHLKRQGFDISPAAALPALTN